MPDERPGDDRSKQEDLTLKEASLDYNWEQLGEALAGLITAPKSGPPDIAGLEEEQFYQDAEEEKLRLENDSLRQDIEYRGRYAKLFFRLAVAWLVGVFAVIALAGFGESTCFKLSETVLVALLGSVTINVVSLLVIVANYLFPKSKQ